MSKGDKVLYRPRRRSAGFRVKAIVEGVSASRITIALQGTNRLTGQPMTITKKVTPAAVEPANW